MRDGPKSVTWGFLDRPWGTAYRRLLRRNFKSCAMRIWAILLLGLWLGACASLDEFYKAETAEAYPATQNVAVVDGGRDAEAAYAAQYRTANYRRIGQINFTGKPFD